MGTWLSIAYADSHAVVVTQIWVHGCHKLMLILSYALHVTQIGVHECHELMLIVLQWRWHRYGHMVVISLYWQLCIECDTAMGTWLSIAFGYSSAVIVTHIWVHGCHELMLTVMSSWSQLWTCTVRYVVLVTVMGWWHSCGYGHDC